MRRASLTLLAATLMLALLVAQVAAATRVYLMRGLLELSPFGRLESSLRAKGAIVTNWSWLSEGAVVADALQHRGDRIIIAGHSMGDFDAFIASADLKARGVKVMTIGLDPLCTWPYATKGLVQYNVWGNYCFGVAHTVPGAINVYLPSAYGHIGYPADPRVIRYFVRKVFP